MDSVSVSKPPLVLSLQQRNWKTLKKKNLRYSGRELNGELIIRNNYIKKIDILDTYYLIFNLNNDCDAVFGDL